MVFSSLTFIAFFLPIVILLYFVCKNKTWRNVILLIFSLVFYAWGEPIFVLMMIISILVNYVCGRMIEVCKHKAAKNTWMIIGVVLSLGFLFFFKYFAFLGNTIINLFNIQVNAIPNQILPIGISFYTFQILTYTIDVWRGKVPAQHSMIKLGLYISFFPQLIAGPIVNYTYIEPYLDERTIHIKDFFEGIFRFFIGLGKKVLIANMCGEILNMISLTGSISVLGAWLGAIAFTLQIYFDFSGYSDMAIGMGHMFGFNFMENFNYPYTSTSVTDFWRRWHISLSSFFRDYVYIPMGGNRCNAVRHIFNLLVVWMLTGFWHGASWNFVVWGLYYGILLILEKYVWGRLIDKLPKIVGWIYTIFIVIIGWVFFYHESLKDGLAHIGAMFGKGVVGATDPVSIYAVKYYAIILIIAVLACVCWKLVFKKLVKKCKKNKTINTIFIVVKFVYGTALFALCIISLAGSSFNPFLYFRF